MRALLHELATQWRGNRRLRIALGLALLIGAAHLAVSLGAARQATVAQYAADAALLARLQGAAADAAWKTRADEATAAVLAAEAGFTRVASAGEAQAELQARLAGLAATAGLGEARVRSEAAVAVEEQPDLLEVAARLEAAGPVAAVDALLLALVDQPALRVERVEVRDGAVAQLQLIVRGHFLLGPASGAAP